MTKQQFQQLLEDKGIPSPPLPSDDVLPPDADIEEYLAQVYLHCARVERKLIRREEDRVFEVWVDKKGRFHGSLRMMVEPVMEVTDEAQ